METIEQIKLGEAVKQVPAIWDIVKADVMIKNNMMTLSYFGTMQGEILMCTITKFSVGSVFRVSCEWAGQDVSEFLKSHIMNLQK